MDNTIQEALYNQRREFSATIGRRPIQVVTKQGFEHWDTIDPASLVLANTIKLSADAQVLLLGCKQGALGVVLAEQASAGEVVLTDTNLIALQMAELTLKANGVRNARMHSDISVLPEYANAFDVVVLELPKGRSLARRWLVESYVALKPGGKLYLAGANDMGIKSAIMDAEALYGNASVGAYKSKNRVAIATKGVGTPGKPAWAQEAGVAPGTWYSFNIELGGLAYAICSLPGVFSFDRLDDGTKLLVSTLGTTAGLRVLDVGCGYGIIGIHAARLGAQQVDMIDVNLLAVACALNSARQNNVANTRAFASDALNAVGANRYDLIVTNPPFHTGKIVDYRMAHAFIQQARSVLAPGGKFVLVANRFIRYDELLAQVFGQVERVIADARYHVWSASA